MANPLFVNPSIAGTSMGSRSTLMYRNQWPNLYSSFESFSASFDQTLENINLGFGASFISTKIGGDALVSSVLSAYYAYHLKPTKELNINLGIKGTYFQKNINWNRINTSIVYDTVKSMIGNGIGIPSAGFINYDLGIGASFSYGELFFGGFSFDHLNTPNVSFYKDDTLTNLGVKTSIFAGVNVFTGRKVFRKIKNSDISYTPTIFYQGSSGFKQLSIGSFFNFGFLIIGCWYRLDFNNDSAYIGLIGARFNNLAIGYSFDYSISNESTFNGGAHEIILSFQVNNELNRKRSTKLGPIQSPVF